MEKYGESRWNSGNSMGDMGTFRRETAKMVQKKLYLECPIEMKRAH